MSRTHVRVFPSPSIERVKVIQGAGDMPPAMRAGFAPVLAAALVIAVFMSTAAGAQSVGVCYGLIGNDLPAQSDVVQLYKFKGISNMRLYSPDGGALDALRGSGIGLILGTTNDDVTSLAASQSFAASWVQANVKLYYPAVKIKYIAVGNEISGVATRSILTAMRNLNRALSAAGLAGGIKVSTAVRFDVIADSFPPSKASFADPSIMAPVARYLARTGAPLLANVYPYFAYSSSPSDISLGYALFQPGAAPVRDGGSGLLYTNLFDAMVDAIYAALEKAGAPHVKVVLSETGWPSAGGVAATVENARAYNQGLIDHVAHGTPRRRRHIEAYLFAMFNENLKAGEATEKNFGLLYPNKSSVYPIRF